MADYSVTFADFTYVNVINECICFCLLQFFAFARVGTFGLAVLQAGRFVESVHQRRGARLQLAPDARWPWVSIRTEFHKRRLSQETMWPLPDKIVIASCYSIPYNFFDSGQFPIFGPLIDLSLEYGWGKNKIFKSHRLTKVLNIYLFRPLCPSMLPPNNLLLDSVPNLGPLISHRKIYKFENCWYKSVRILEVLKLLFQQFLNLSSFQRDMSVPILGDLSNNRWSGGSIIRGGPRIGWLSENGRLEGS
jgi:hypothetical protein